jgi:hypothetical protein
VSADLVSADLVSARGPSREVTFELPVNERTSKLADLHPHYAMSLGSALAGITMAEPDGVSDAVVSLASEMSRTVTATQLTLDMGATKI